MRVSTFETLIFSLEPPRAPGSPSILRAEWRTKKHFNGAFARGPRLPSVLPCSTGYNFATASLVRKLLAAVQPKFSGEWDR